MSKRLWNAVILQAFEDSTSIDLKPENVCSTYQARSWLMGGSKDFHEVCLLAGIEQAAVGNMARGMCLENWPKVKNRFRKHAAARVQIL